ncbi:L-amino acid N-acyltransferase YncA [Halovenus aranensis]|uniref:L-amino acid N-acyltransferase YncA n=1 Tax=Halovenus aranensis TaxID=890420 RepID=A0A1G8Z0N9_9EURY|nr:GNAT family N-acetyltransferase [Halovenus aranensis]SDK08547.1 L-amino acid N-acyltransferase YncA [Halovenus aranensis]
MSETEYSGFEIREATHDDYEGVAAIAAQTWDGDDYLTDVYHDWLDGEQRHTLVGTVGDDVAGIAQIVMLSPHEAWGQGLRTAPAHRGKGISEAITYELFDWAREQGAVVSRAMVYSWNQAGLGQSRSTGYEPVTEFRWIRPEPMSGALPASVSCDPDAAWGYWTGSDAAQSLSGLTLSMDESWAVQELTPALLDRAADETSVLTVADGDGTHGFAYRSRTFERETDGGEVETWAEYGVAAWDSLDSARTVVEAIRVDAADCGADRTRVLIPETAGYVSDGAYIRANIGDEPDFVVAADLTADYRRDRPTPRSR